MYNLGSKGVQQKPGPRREGLGESQNSAGKLIDRNVRLCHSSGI